MYYTQNHNEQEGVFMNDHPTKQETDYVRRSLEEFNNQRVGADGHTPLALVEYGEDGSVIGGILGGT